MKAIRIGIVGVGNIGATHARHLLEGRVPRLQLVALANRSAARLAAFPQVPHFPDAASMIKAGGLDALLVATPHYDHPDLGIAALKAGLHLMVEKPIGVHKADAARLIAAAQRRPGQVFAAMLNLRTDPHYKKIRAMIQAGELGEIRRVNWIMTTWFRPEVYFASTAWRATWKHDGGGVLFNQSPHNLDLLQWMVGLPSRVRAHCGFGRYHNIEVEDDVTAYFEFPNGATGVFITSTGEAPGTNRLEIAGERGRLLYENGAITFTRNAVPMSEFSRTTKEAFGHPATETISIPVDGQGGQHVEMLENFAAAILDGAPLIAPGAEGMASVELACAMVLSSWTEATVKLPISGATYARELSRRVRRSKHVKTAPPAGPVVVNMNSSYSR